MKHCLRSQGTNSVLGVATAGLLLVVGALLLSWSALVPAEEAKSATPPAPQKPLGKDTKWKVTKPDPSKPVEEADNSYCLVCHVNLEEEELVDIHLPVGVGCETCHGMSDDHSADEDSLTPPEIMWSKARINPRCMTCHTREELLADKTVAEPHREMFQRWETPEKAEPGEKYCVQCHGKHRVPNRTRQWDQETGKLLKRLGGPSMDR